MEKWLRRSLLAGLTVGLVAVLGCGGFGAGPSSVSTPVLAGKTFVYQSTGTINGNGFTNALVGANVFQPDSGSNPIVTMTSSDPLLNGKTLVITSITSNHIVGYVDVTRGRAVIRYIITLDFGPNGVLTITITINGNSITVTATLTSSSDGNNTGDTTGGAGSSAGDTSGNTTATVALSADQKNRVQRTITFLQAVNPLLTAYLNYVHNNVAPKDGYSKTYYSNPTITVARSGNTLNLTFDWGSTAQTYFGKQVAGKVVAVSDLKGNATLTLQNFSVNSQPISGTLVVSGLAGGNAATGSSTVALNLQVSAIPTVAGSALNAVSGSLGLSFTTNAAGVNVITLNTTGVTLDTDSLALSNITVAPLTTGNFIPTGGTATLSLGTGDNVALTFSTALSALVTKLNGTVVTFTPTI